MKNIIIILFFTLPNIGFADEVDDHRNQVNVYKDNLNSITKSVGQSLVWLRYSLIMGKISKIVAESSQVTELMDSNKSSLSIPASTEVTDLLLNSGMGEVDAFDSFKLFSNKLGNLEKAYIQASLMRVKVNQYAMVLTLLKNEIDAGICQEQGFTSVTQYLDFGTAQIDFQKFFKDFEIGIKINMNNSFDPQSGELIFNADGADKNESMKYAVSSVFGVAAGMIATGSMTGPWGTAASVISAVAMILTKLTLDLAEFQKNKSRMNVKYGIDDDLYNSMNVLNDVKNNYNKYCGNLQSTLKVLSPMLGQFISILNKNGNVNQFKSNLLEKRMSLVANLKEIEKYEYSVNDLMDKPVYFEAYFLNSFYVGMDRIINNIGNINIVSKILLEDFFDLRSEVEDQVAYLYLENKGQKLDKSEENFKHVYLSQMRFEEFRHQYANQLEVAKGPDVSSEEFVAIHYPLLEAIIKRVEKQKLKLISAQLLLIKELKKDLIILKELKNQ